MNEHNGDGAVEVPAGVRALVERERTKLLKASALLACLHVATVHDFEINVADVVDVANDLVGDVIEALDIVNLKRAANAPDADEENEQAPPG